MARAYLALNASGVGAPDQLAEAIRRLSQHAQIDVGARSGIVTVPAATRRDRDAHHIVVAVETGLKPKALLEACHAVEIAMGRGDAEVWARLTIDMDLIVYEDHVVRSSRLTLPHPYAHSRAYVIEPLREIAPEVAEWVVERSKAPQ
jgi:2-amino-4-hydroxy-6-hydroxymethyldihydropteridine diphosphokinase